MDIYEVLEALQKGLENETETSIISTYMFEIGYLTCMAENDIDDDRLHYVITNILEKEV